MPQTFRLASYLHLHRHLTVGLVTRVPLMRSTAITLPHRLSGAATLVTTRPLTASPHHQSRVRLVPVVLEICFTHTVTVLLSHRSAGQSIASLCNRQAHGRLSQSPVSRTMCRHHPHRRSTGRVTISYRLHNTYGRMGQRLLYS